MRITYTAPNRAHHYAYARAMAEAGCLEAFVCGFSRFSPRAALPEIGAKLVRADHLQNFFLAAQRLKLPTVVCDELSYWSKRWLDRRSAGPARRSDVFLFYSGAGLGTAARLRGTGTARVVEAVNSHVLVQERILREEYARIGLPFKPFHPREVARRVMEYETADAILCPSDFVRQSFEEEGIPAARIFTVPYGMTLPTAPPRRKTGDGTFRVLYVGQISVRKGLRYLLEAFAQFDHPKKELCIVGPMTPDSGIAEVALPPGTRFLGVLKGEELTQAYQSATVFVLPTLEEGLSLVLGEAMSFGLPLITTEQSGGSNLFSDGRQGFIVPSGSGAAIAGKLQMLADDAGLREEMSLAAAARAQSLGGWDTAGKLLLAAMASASAMSRAGAVPALPN
jgi:alpha-maltose-1-phosphate synthase